MKILAVPLTLLMLAIPSPCAAADATACPKIIAHKTNPLEAPEDSIQGILSVPATQAQAVEVDLRFNKSNWPVAMHDKTVDRTTTGTGNVNTYYLPDIVKLSAADYAPWNTDPRFAGFWPDGTPKVKVPYTWDIVNAANTSDVDLLLDVKETPPNAEAAYKIWDYLNRFNYFNRTIYMGSPESITAMRALYPSLQYMLIEYPAATYMGRSASYLKSLGVIGYAVPFGSVDENFVNYYRANNIQVYTWTSDNVGVDVYANWQKMADAGVTALVTNNPKAARESITQCQ